MAVQLNNGSSALFRFPDIRSSLPAVPVAEATDKRTFEIRRLKGKDKPMILDFLRSFFFHDEPINMAIGLVSGNEVASLDTFALSTIEDNLSLGAVAPDGTLVGVCINAAHSLQDDEEGRAEYAKEAADVIEDVTSLKDLNDKFAQVKRLLSGVSAEGKVFEHAPEGVDRLLDIFILSVDDSWRGKGIARKLLEQSREVAQSEGYRLMRCICTSYVSALLVSRQGYRCIHRLNYKNIKDQKGQVIFPTQPPHESVTTYVLDL